MTQIQAVTTGAAPAALGAYTPAVTVDGWCYVSGQVGWDADYSGLDVRTPAQQTEQTLRNIEALLDAAGATLRDVVRTTVFVASFEIVTEVNAAYERVFREAGAEVLPARTTVPAPLAVAVEIDAIARVPR